MGVEECVLGESIFAFDREKWIPPTSIVLDTSVVVEAVIETQPEYSSCF